MQGEALCTCSEAALFSHPLLFLCVGIHRDGEGGLPSESPNLRTEESDTEMLVEGAVE